MTTLLSDLDLELGPDHVFVIPTGRAEYYFDAVPSPSTPCGEAKVLDSVYNSLTTSSLPFPPPFSQRDWEVGCGLASLFG